MDAAKRPSAPGIQALASNWGVAVESDESIITDDPTTTTDDAPATPTAAPVDLWLPAEGAAQPLPTNVNVLALGANLTLPSQLEAGSTNEATDEGCDGSADVSLAGATSGGELASGKVTSGFSSAATVAATASVDSGVPNGSQSSLTDRVETTVPQFSVNGPVLDVEGDLPANATPTVDSAASETDDANSVIGGPTVLSPSDSVSTVSVPAQVPSESLGEPVQLSDTNEFSSGSETEASTATAVEGETTGAEAAASGNLGHTLPRSASPTAVRVHAAIEQARSLNIPPASLVAEKFAASGERVTNGPRPEDARGQRKSIDIAAQQVASSYVNVGINVAKAESAMPAPTTFTPSPSDAVEAVSFTPAPISFEALVNPDTANPALASGARRAVESAVAISERFASSDRSSVNLQFNVSGVDLAVRVEMRADGVHTTFRTDSPELRAVLAHEWQSVTAQTPDRAVRLAEPTFSAGGSGSGLQSDAGSSHQQQSSARETPSFAGMFPAGRTLNRVSSVAAATTSLPVAVASAPGRLHTFA